MQVPRHSDVCSTINHIQLHSVLTDYTSSASSGCGNMKSSGFSGSLFCTLVPQLLAPVQLLSTSLPSDHIDKHLVTNGMV